MKRKAAMRGEDPAGPAGRAGREGISGAPCLRCGPAAQHQRGEADLIDEGACTEPGGYAAAVPEEPGQGGDPGGRAQELINLSQHVRQAGQPGRVVAAGHGAVPAAVAPNPAQAEVPGWAEYASSATVTGPAAALPAW